MDFSSNLSLGNSEYYSLSVEFNSHTLKFCVPRRRDVCQKQCPEVSVGTLLDVRMYRSNSQESQQGPLSSHCEASWKYNKHFIKIKEIQSFIQPKPLIITSAVA